MCVLSEAKDVNVFNMITRLNEVRTLVNMFHVIVNVYSIVQHAVQTKNGMMINLKSVAHAKKIVVGILSHVFARIVGI